MNDVERFEKSFGEAFNLPNPVAVCNGTAAIDVALEALKFRPGQVVLTTPFTFPAPVNRILSHGMRPHFVDIDPETYCLDVNLVDDALSEVKKMGKKVWGILVVHLFGNIADVRTLEDICYMDKIHLIEDASQALGAESGGDPAGGFGDAGTFSFFASKNLWTYEGGMVVFKDVVDAEAARMIRNHGLDEYGHMRVMGSNYKLAWPLASHGDTMVRLHKKAILAELGKDGPKDYPDIYGRLVTDHPYYKRLGLEAHCPVAEGVAAEVRASIRA